MEMEVAPGIRRIALALGHSAAPSVNCYLIRDHEGYLLVDCGWDGPGELERFLGELRDIGVDPKDIHTLVVTHCHTDHYGLAGSLREVGRFRLLMHRLDWQDVCTHMLDASAAAQGLIAWVERNGLCTEGWPEKERRTLGFLDRFTVAPPDAELEDGDVIEAGDRRLRVLFTPGHSQGHICLYDQERHLLISGDHVLESIAPHVAMSRRFTGDPLSECMAALRRIENLDVDLVLPGHGEPFRGFNRRVGELVAHHERREQAVLEILSRGAATGAQVAGEMSWTRRSASFGRLPPILQRLALGQTMSHLEKLRLAGRASREERDGVVYYRSIHR